MKHNTKMSFSVYFVYNNFQVHFVYDFISGYTGCEKNCALAIGFFILILVVNWNKQFYNKFSNPASIFVCYIKYKV